jgi:DNA-directed RNA polymerase specialized sigma24 family protein
MLTSDWQTTDRHRIAGRTMAVWRQESPLLGSFTSPAEVVDAINRSGDPNRSCALLGELLVVALKDPIAARAVLQAVIPGLLAAVDKRWSKAAGHGPWQSQQELVADALSAAWEAIHAHAGEQHLRPAAIIVRLVEGSLRRAHIRWTRHRGDPLPARPAEPSQSAMDAAYSTEQQAARLVSEAQSSGAINGIEATLLTRVGIYGYTVAQTERDLAMTPGSAPRALRRARHALRTWLRTPPAIDDLASSIEHSLILREPGSSTPRQPQPATTGASR